MKVIIPKITELLASNVTEAITLDFSTATSYGEGDKVYVPYSDFPELLSYPSCIYDVFDTGTGWDYDGTNSAYDCDGSQVGDSLLTQTNGSLVSGDSYLVVYEVQARSAGNIAPYVGGTSGTDKAAIGWYFEVVTAGATDSKIGLVADLDFVGQVSNISIKKVSPSYVAKNIYESLTGANQGNWPPGDATNWVRISASNRWKMFDDYMGSQTEKLDKVSVKVKCNKCNTLAFFIAEATSLKYIISDDGKTETSTTSMTPGSGDKSFTMSTGNTWATAEKVEIYRTSDQRAFMAGTITAWNQGTGAITVSVTDYDDPAAAAPYTNWTIARVYDHETAGLYQSTVISWSEYFFSPIIYYTSKSYSFTYSFNTSCRAIFTSATNKMVRIGHMIVGNSIYLGNTKYGIRGGITDFSIKEANDFGEYTLTKRSFAAELKYTLYVAQGSIDQVFQTLSQVRATPCVWDANEDSTSYTFAIVYGFFSDFEVGIPEYNGDECDLQIQGLA